MTLDLLTLCAAWALSAGTAPLSTERFALRFAADGQPTSLRALPGGEDLLNTRNPGAGFYLQAAGGRRTPLSAVTLGADGRLTARSADGTQAVVLSVRTAERYLALRIERLDGIPAQRGVSLHLELNADARLRFTELDYMTRIDQSPGGPRAHWDDLWHRTPGEPLGGVALFVRTDEADEDETLLRIWASEQLAHPRVTGEWTLDRARAWLAQWQRTFANRSQLILEGANVDELRAALPWAKRAKIDELYLFTQTWRTDNFWPGSHGNLHVNRQVFPRGEDDLRAFADEVHAQGLRLNLHYVSGGVGKTDPTYVGTHPDRRLAGWVKGTLARPITAGEVELIFTPPPGAAYPPDLPHFFEHNNLRLDDELLVIGSFEPQPDGTWRLHRCRRGQFGTQAAAHPAGTEGQGLVVAYGQNYVPDNDSPMLDEMAANYAALINRCRIGHTEYDGAEIHCYNGRWGYLKFATRVYQNIDHPVTAHDSSGSAPRCNYEYRFNSTKRLLRGTCVFTHGNWSAPIELASPGRVASTVLDANFVLSQGHLGGALGLCKPEPMFAVSDKSLKAHGLTEPTLDALLGWKAVSRLLTDAQRATLDASFSRPGSRAPEASRHVQSRYVQTVRKAADGYRIVPVCVLTRERGDIRWQQGQEHGAVSPRQYVKPGETLSLENPFAAQPAGFIVRVLWGSDPAGPTVPLKPQRGQTGPSKPSDLFTAGNAPGGAPRATVPNVRLQPTLADLRLPADNRLKTTVAAEGAGLRLTAENAGANGQWTDLQRLPEWSASVDLNSRRALGLRITGDGSGAVVLFAIGGRDYVVKVDFTGPRDIEVPNGEVAWAAGDWGWRMDTKRVDYAHPRYCRLALGYLPPHSRASVLVENLTALAEVPAALVNPVIHTGAGTLTVHGRVASGQYLRYDGGPTAGVFDENWHKLAELPVTPQAYVMPTGYAPVSITAAAAAAPPWLEVQFLTEGEVLLVPEAR